MSFVMVGRKDRRVGMKNFHLKYLTAEGLEKTVVVQTSSRAIAWDLVERFSDFGTRCKKSLT